MRECGYKCGMHHVEICFESIAATFDVINTQKDESNESKRLKFVKDDQIVLLDMGGGTIDAACLKFLDDGMMEETRHRDGLKIGGAAVDQAFEALLSNIFGDTIIPKFQKELKKKCANFIFMVFDARTNKKSNPQAWLQQKYTFWSSKHSLPVNEQWNVKLDMHFKDHLETECKSLTAIREKLQAHKINGKSKSGKKNFVCI
ncbi:hypothetical protein RFI_27737 [Reticulomyxa filosa]|uniref:Heat shock protein 70 n=1 Tax=Reticulomyxa filosa TaxID=46433 RepID=X6M9E6_RETFI|nr:hypothetical protein RFI_27737 [Reticulomyxa filosa]|eukprot:ETO09640.1 hypothetical protein RFI_27737 [Reticulomyxa filosa]